MGFVIFQNLKSATQRTKDDIRFSGQEQFLLIIATQTSPWLANLFPRLKKEIIYRRQSYFSHLSVSSIYFVLFSSLTPCPVDLIDKFTQTFSSSCNKPFHAENSTDTLPPTSDFSNPSQQTHPHPTPLLPRTLSQNRLIRLPFARTFFPANAVSVFFMYVISVPLGSLPDKNWVSLYGHKWGDATRDKPLL